MLNNYGYDTVYADQFVHGTYDSDGYFVLTEIFGTKSLPVIDLSPEDYHILAID